MMDTLGFVLLCAGVIVLGIYLAYLRSPKRKGKVGEAVVGRVLSDLPPEYVVLNDIVLKTSRGTTQIDHVVVSPCGVFGIETKNYRGEIYGDDGREKWTQVIVTDVTYRKKPWKTYTYVTKNQFYNPVKQSLGHVLTLKENLAGFGYVPMVPVVVFTGAVDLSNVRSEYPVVHTNSLVALLRSYGKRYLTDEQAQSMASRIDDMNIRDAVKDKEHVRNIRMAASERDRKVSSGICPRCGGRLVLRQGKYGSFYGCSNYPKCRFTHGG